MSKKLIAVYGSLREGLHNYYHYLEESKLVGSFQTEPLYSLYDLGSYPGLKLEGNTKITLEVFEVTEDVEDSVDGLEGYRPHVESVFYDKIQIETPFGTAGLYIYVPSVTDRTLVESGDWVEYLDSKDNEKKNNI